MRARQARARRPIWYLAAAVLLSAALTTSGCALDRWAIRQVANLLTGDAGSTVFTGDDDPQLVADALPFTLKLHESLLAADAENPALHLATGRLFITYGSGFVHGPARRLPDAEFAARRAATLRAKRFVLRGRRYVLDGIELRHPGFAAALEAGDVPAALALVERQSIDYLYWLGAGALAAFSTDSFDMELLVTLPHAVALLEQVDTWDPAYDAGAVHEILISYYGGVPESLGGSEQRARYHFERAVALSAGAKAGPYLALATAISVPNQDAAEFRTLLEAALAVDLEVAEYRLANILAQRQAQWLLARMEDYFLDLPEELPEELPEQLPQTSD